MKDLLRVAALGIAMSLVAPAASSACSCIIETAGCGAAADFWRTEAVFLGRVERIERAAKEGVPRVFQSRVVTLQVIEAFRGVTAGEITIYTGAGGGDCGYPFRGGEEYLVYASRSSGDRLVTGICSRTRPAARAADDLEYARTAAAGQALPGRITGTVHLEQRPTNATRGSRVPAPDVAVRMRGTGVDRTARTDSNGQYVFLEPAAGKYTLHVDAPDGTYGNQLERTVELNDPRACAGADFVLLPDGRVAGRVTSRGRGIGGLTVELTDFSGTARVLKGEPITAMTRRDGSYELTRVPPGRFLLGINLRAKDEEYVHQPRLFYPGVDRAPAAAVVTVAAGERLALNTFEIPPAIELVQIVGIVFEPGGAPVPGARVFLKSGGESGYVIGEPVSSDTQGEFRLAAIDGADYQIFAEYVPPGTSPGNSDFSPPVTLIAAPDLAPLRLVLRRAH